DPSHRGSGHRRRFRSGRASIPHDPPAPEIGRTLTIGGVITPRFLPGFSLSIDYYRIKVTNIIETLTAQQILTNCYNAGGSGAEECDWIERASPTTFPNQVNIFPANRLPQACGPGL